MPAAGANASTADQLAAGAIVFGLVSLVTCWWFPFGAVLGLVGALSGIGAWWGETGGGRRGDQAVVGTALSVAGAGAALLLAWDEWRIVFGS